MILAPLAEVLAALRHGSPVVTGVPAALRYQLLRNYLDLSRRNGRFGLVSWLLTIFGMASAAPWPLQMAAALLFGGLVLLRESRVKHLLNRLDAADPHPDPTHDLAVLATTGLWGWAPTVFAPHLPEPSLMGLATVSILALSAMAVGYIHALPASMLALVCGMLPVVGFFVWRADVTSLLLGLASFLSTLALLQRLRLNHATLLQALLTERENARLVEELQRYRDTLETENVQLNESLRDASIAAGHDGLTGLSNRRHLSSFAASLEQSVRNEREAVTLCVIDIDHFKRVNDSHGHVVGDEVLKAVANRLKNRLRDQDCLARYGGEEFVAVLRRCNLKRASSVAQALRLGIGSEAVPTTAGRLDLTVSVGVAQWMVYEDFEDAFQRADRALYRAKEFGRDQVVVDESAVRSFASSYVDTAPMSRPHP